MQSTVAVTSVASHAGVFRGARFRSLPTNACSTEDNSPCLAWERSVVFGWAGVCREGWKTSSPKNACVGGYHERRSREKYQPPRPYSLFSGTRLRRQNFNLAPTQHRQLRRLCGPQFLSYLPKHFTNLLRSLFGDAILVTTETVHQYGRRKSTKTSRVHFFYKSSFFSLEG